MLMDLLSSKKFKALLALVILWTKPVHDAIGLQDSAMPWLTAAFCAYFIAQGLRDFGEEITKAATFLATKKPPEKDEDDE